MPATAAIITVNGALTVNDPVFNRPLAGNPPSGTSGVGTAVRYDTLAFTVAANGTYSFLLDSGGSFDTFLVLYAGSFSPGSPLTNIAIANDDFTTGNFTQSGFNRPLVTGVNYIAVFTSFNNGELGGYTFTLDVPGGAVPEPTTWAMMIAGFGMIGAATRYRRAGVRVALG